MPTSLGYVDPRAEGELLWSERFTAAGVETQGRDLGTKGKAAQHEQRPMPPGGGIFKREHTKHWQVAPRDAVFIQSWDCAFKGLDDSDWVVGQVWAAAGGKFYLLDQFRERTGVRGTLSAIVRLSGKWKKTRKKLIEDKANGPAVIEMLQGELGGIEAINPQGGKASRANAVAPLWESGNILLPEPRVASWVPAFLEEVEKFSGDPNDVDDQVDAMTQAVNWLYAGNVNRYREAMEKAGTMGAIVLGGGR